MTALKRIIKTFAVLDFETNNLPQFNFNRVRVTELSLYAFSAEELLRHSTQPACGDSAPPPVPKRPRILHQLTMMINPLAPITPVATRITGLDNWMLELESPFNENTTKTILSFLQHLQQPVCLVAHFGHGFDFPILKESIERTNCEIPGNILCVDSLEAFWDIEEQRKSVAPITSTTDVKIRSEISELTNDLNELAKSYDETISDFRQLNETTPKRRTNNANAMGIRKRRCLVDNEIEGQSTPTTRPRALFPEKEIDEDTTNTVRPTANEQNCNVKWHRQKGYVPRSIYKLANLYERTFQTAPENCHMAEYDVIMLMRLMQHFGEDFLTYAEQMAIPLTEVLPLGTKINR